MHMFDYKNFCDRHLDIITLKMRIFYAVTLFLITPLLITLFTNTRFNQIDFTELLLNGVLQLHFEEAILKMLKITINLPIS